MANRYINLVGSNKIKDEYSKFNTGIDAMQVDMDAEAATRLASDNAIQVNIDAEAATRLASDNTITSRINSHVTSVAEKHSSSGIVNDSTLIGANVSVVVQSLQGQIDVMTVAAGNATVGVYAVSGTGTNTLTCTFSALTYYSGLKMNVSITNDNTAGVTINLNSLGAKNIYKVVLNVKTALSPRDLRIGEIAQIQYDGTDFILLNGNRNDEYSATQISTDNLVTLPSTSQGLIDEMIVKGRTYTNLLTDAVAGCESTSGWTATATLLTTDSVDELEGTNCFKFVDNGSSSNIIYPILSLMNTSKYYLLSAHIKSNNISGGLVFAFTSDDQNVIASAVTSTSYTRVGVVIQPSDFNTATYGRIYLASSGSTSEFGFIDAIALHEISASDYALGVPALLNKYEWHLNTKSVDKMRVLSVGKNLFDKEKARINTFVNNSDGLIGSSTGDNSSDYITIKPSTVYSCNAGIIGGSSKGVSYYDSNRLFISSQSQASGLALFTTPSNARYLRFSMREVTVPLSAIILNEGGAILSTYEPYQQTQSTCNLPLRSVPAITDTWDAVRGKHVKNISNFLNLSGSTFTWAMGADFAGFKQFQIAGFSAAVGTVERSGAEVAASKLWGLGNREITWGVSSAGANYFNLSIGYLNLALSDTDTGFDEAWITGTVFTGMTWTLLVRAFMNGWKLTTVNVNVASCVWTGITSGTTKTGAGGYTDVTTTLDVGFTPYTMIYQLATPITTYLQPNVLSANGTIYQENFVEDYGFFNAGIPLSDNTKLITNLVEVRKWNLNDGSYVIVPTSTVTLTTGVITAITSAVTGEFYTFDYNYDDSLGLNGELNYSYAVNMAGQVKLNTENVITLDKKVEDLDEMVSDRVLNLDNKILNASYSSTQVSTNSINTLPSTSQGLIDEMIVKGRTYTNLLADAVAGCESTSGWTPIQSTVATDSSNKLEGTNCLKITTTASTSGLIFINILPLMKQGKYYMVSANLKNFDNATNIRLGLNLNGDAGVSYATNATTNYTRVGLLVQPSNFDTATDAYLIIESVGAIGQYGFVDTIALHEISDTDYALGVPTLLNKYVWHLGTKSVDKMRVLSVGKNLFDKTKVTVDKVLNSTTGGIATSAGNSISDYVQIKPSTSYKLNINLNSATFGHCYYDENKVYISGYASATTSAVTLTTPTSAKYVRLSMLSTNLDLLQLELGSTATTYEPYQQTQSTCNIPLRSVPAITDTWDAVRGKHVKNISDEQSISSTAYASLDTSTYTNVDIVKTTAFTSMVAGTTALDNKTNVYNKDGILLSEVSQGNIDLVASVGKYYYHTDKTIWFIVSNGAYVDIASARTGLATSKAYLQLSTPITTYLQPNVLSANANGTIYQEHFVEDYGFFNAGIPLSDSTKLITNLVEVRKWNLNDGSYIIVPTSTVTLTNGVITAITSAITGEFYTFDYNYANDLSLNGEMNYSYAVNMAGQVSLNTENIITVDKKVEDLSKSVEDVVKVAMPFIYDTGLSGGFSSLPIFIAPKNITIKAITMISQGSFVGVDGGNPFTATIINEALATVATKVFTAAPANTEVLTITPANTKLLAGAKLLLNHTYGGTANPPSVMYQIEYI